MSWIGTSPSPLRSDRSSTALIAYSPFAEIRIDQRAVPGSARPGRRRASPNHRLALAGGATIIRSPRTAGPQPRDLLRLALPFIGSPPTAGAPPPHPPPLRPPPPPPPPGAPPPPPRERGPHHSG